MNPLSPYALIHELLSGLEHEGQSVPIVNGGAPQPTSGLYVLLQTPLSAGTRTWDQSGFDVVTVQVDVYGLDDPLGVASVAQDVKARLRDRRLQYTTGIPLAPEADGGTVWYRSMQTYETIM